MGITYDDSLTMILLGIGAEVTFVLTIICNTQIYYETLLASSAKNKVKKLRESSKDLLNSFSKKPCQPELCFLFVRGKCPKFTRKIHYNKIHYKIH